MQHLSSKPSSTFANDIAACRALLSTGSRTFYAASYLLPKRVRNPACALYAFCRIADDIIDLSSDGVAGLADLNNRLTRAYDGRPIDHPADRAFAETVLRFQIPSALPEALLEGFQWDASHRQYENLAELQAYAARVAGTVGAMMALLMGRRSDQDLARAIDLGIAMQLTNIARDVGEDARAGRLYLPRTWLREVGIDPDQWLAKPIFSPQLASVVARLTAVAESLYLRAEAGISRLPADCRPGIYAARYLYAAIGQELARRGHDSIAQRAIVPKSRKLRLLARAIVAAPMTKFSRSPDGRASAVPEAAFLVAASVDPVGLRDAHDSLPGQHAPWWDVYSKALLLVEVLDRLERREKAARSERIRAIQSRSSQFHVEVQT